METRLKAYLSENENKDKQRPQQQRQHGNFYQTRKDGGTSSGSSSERRVRFKDEIQKNNNTSKNRRGWLKTVRSVSPFRSSPSPNKYLVVDEDHDDDDKYLQQHVEI